jgi:hypothetical protein
VWQWLTAWSLSQAAVLYFEPSLWLILLSHIDHAQSIILISKTIKSGMIQYLPHNLLFSATLLPTLQKMCIAVSHSATLSDFREANILANASRKPALSCIIYLHLIFYIILILTPLITNCNLTRAIRTENCRTVVNTPCYCSSLRFQYPIRGRLCQIYHGHFITYSINIACWIEYAFGSNTVVSASRIKQYQMCLTFEDGPDRLSRNDNN